VPIVVSRFLAGMDGQFSLYPSCMVLHLFSMNRAYHRGVAGSAWLWTLVMLISTSALAGDSNQSSLDPTKQTISQGSSSLVAVPNRPTFSTTAEAVQRGVFEVEFGLEAADAHQNFNGLLKFGLLRNLELRFGTDPMLRESGVAGFGDSNAGLKFRFLRQNGAMPTLSALYTATIPSATAGLGAAALGHSVGILVSKDFGRHHLDFNESLQWLGRPEANGFDRNCFTAVAYEHPLTAKIQVMAEIAGYSRANIATPSTLTVLMGMTFAVSPRLVLDGGSYIAAHGNLPRATFFLGTTYSIVDLYHHRR
jgi:hypothetical protein